MADSEFQHSEAFLQWIWENLLFDFTDLRTASGESVQIINPGSLNSTDGPDFKGAVLEIGGMRWYGDVEIHLKNNGWYAHGHHEDPNFNTVILHVVAGGKNEQILCENGARPYVLNLSDYLPQQLKVFLKSFQSGKELPCSSALNFISEEAFLKQIEKAHIEYFEKKSDDFLKFYDPELLPSKAWKQALIISIWDGLGISHNRQAMQQTARYFLDIWKSGSVEDGVRLAIDLAGFGQEPTDYNIVWNFKSVRPSNHPQKRIEQAVVITLQILEKPLEDFLSSHSLKLWNTWLQKNSMKRSSRMEILYGTVFLPSLYMLSKLYAHQKLSELVLSKWKELKTPIPSSLLKKFNSLPLGSQIYRKKLGAIHQLKSYCTPVRCSECFVLKNAIQS